MTLELNNYNNTKPTDFEINRNYKEINEIKEDLYKIATEIGELNVQKKSELQSGSIKIGTQLLEIQYESELSNIFNKLCNSHKISNKKTTKERRKLYKTQKEFNEVANELSQVILKKKSEYLNGRITTGTNLAELHCNYKLKRISDNLSTLKKEIKTSKNSENKKLKEIQKNLNKFVNKYNEAIVQKKSMSPDSTLSIEEKLTEIECSHQLLNIFIQACNLKDTDYHKNKNELKELYQEFTNITNDLCEIVFQKKLELSQGRVTVGTKLSELQCNHKLLDIYEKINSQKKEEAKPSISELIERQNKFNNLYLEMEAINKQKDAEFFIGLINEETNLREENCSSDLLEEYKKTFSLCKYKICSEKFEDLLPESHLETEAIIQGNYVHMPMINPRLPEEMKGMKFKIDKHHTVTRMELELGIYLKDRVVTGTTLNSKLRKEYKEVARTLSNNVFKAKDDLLLFKEYKIHLMPKPENFFYCVSKLIKKVSEDTILQEHLHTMKFAVSPYDDLSIYENKPPLIVVYPQLGKAHAEKILTILFEHFQSDLSLGSHQIPRFNVETKNDLITYSQGDGYKKEGILEKNPKVFSKMFEPGGAHFSSKLGKDFHLKTPDGF